MADEFQLKPVGGDTGGGRNYLPVRLRMLLRIIILALGCFGAGHLLLTLPVADIQSISYLWLPAGIAVAGLWRWGWRCWPGVLLGTFLVQFVDYSDGYPADRVWLVTVGVSMGSTIGAVAATWLLRRAGFAPAFEHAYNFLRLAACGVIGALLSASIGSTILLLAGQLAASEFRDVLFGWWLGDSMGVAFITPLLLGITTSRLAAVAGRSREVVAWACTLAISIYGSFFLDVLGQPLPLEFLPLLVILWAGLRLGPVVMFAGVLALSLSAMIATSVGVGPFRADAIDPTALELRLYAVFTLFLGWMTIVLSAREERAASKFNGVYQLPLIGMAITSPQRTLIDVNEAFAKMVGRTRRDLIGTSWADITHPDDLAENVRLLQDAIDGKTDTYHMEKRFLRPDRTVVHADISVHCTRTSTGEIDHMALLVQDITARMVAEQAMRESNAERLAFINVLSEGIVVQNASGEITFASDLAPKILGLTLDQILGRTSLDPRWRAFDSDGRPLPGDQHPAMVSLRTGADVRDFVMQVEKPGGTRSWIVVNSTVLRDAGGDIAKVLVGFHDITDIKESQLRQDKLGMMARMATEASGIGVWELDLESGHLTWNEQMSKIYGTDPNRLTHTERDWSDRLHPDDAETLNAKLQRCIETNQSFQANFRIVTPAGETRVIEARSEILKTEPTNSSVLIGTNIDITDKILAEQERATTTARLSAILETAMVGIITVDEQSKITAYNAEAEAILGYSAAEMLGQSLDRLIPAPARDAHPTHVQSFVAGEADHRAMSSWRTVSGLHKDGTLVPLMVGISKIKVADRITMTAIFRDMSEIRDAEVSLRQLASDRELQLHKAENANRAKSQFLATMSHELRTPLNAIIRFSSLIKSEIFGPVGNEKYREYIHDVHASGEYLLSLINDILDLSRIEASKYEFEIQPIDPVAAMNEVAMLVKPLALQKTIALVMPEAIPGCDVLGDRRAVHQVLLNLIGNALKFTAEGGRAQMRVELRRQDDTIALVVSDNGRGIPAHRLDDLGQPFVQVDGAHTRDQGGSGLGLAICKSLAKGMNGSMEIESELGRGTTVRLVLPRAGDMLN